MSSLTRLFLSAAAAASCSLPGHAPADTDFNQVGRAVAEILANRHFSRKPLDANFDQAFVAYLLKQLDPNRMYLLQEDVDWITREFGPRLHESLLSGRTLEVAEPIYQLYQKRVTERHAWVENYLKTAEFNLSQPGRSYQIKREEAPWAPNAEAADQLWIDRLTDEMIRETLRRRIAAERRAEAKTSDNNQASADQAASKTAEQSTATPAAASSAATPVDATTLPTESTAPGTAPAEPAGSSPTEVVPAVNPDSASQPGSPESGSADSGSQTAGEAVPEPEEASPAETLQRRYHRIAEDFESLGTEDIADLFLSNLATSFDPHTDYMSFAEYENFMQSMRNSLIGIGALLRAEDDGTTRIEGIVVGGPADLQGQLKIDDRIIGVDSLNNGQMQDTLFMRLDRVVELVRGQASTEVRLKIHPAESPDDVREIVITRNQVELKDQLATAELYEIKRGEATVRIGWITIPSFYGALEDSNSSISRDVEVLLRRLLSERVNGIVLDLRMNGGGVLEEAVRLTGLFIPRGPVVQIADPFGQSEELRSFNREPIYTGPLAVVTSRLSASASEILAGALQDHHRAVIVGDDRTFGKGTVQRVIDVARQMPLFSDRSRAGSIKVTEQKFYRPSGASTQLDGVASDVVLPSVFTAYDIGEAAEINPLPNDAIHPSDYQPPTDASLHLEALAERSRSRVADSPEFGYIVEDITTLRQEDQRKEVVLDLETRYQELQAMETRRRQRNLEQRNIVAQIAARDAQTLRGWRIDMENVRDPQLHQLSEFTDEDHMRRAVDEDEKLLATPKYPNDLDPIERESLAILEDLIQLQAEAPTVVSNQGASNGGSH